MRLRHLLPNASSRTTVQGDRAFFLRSTEGDFLSLFTTQQTRYAGWFVPDQEGFVKVLEHISVLDEAGEARAIETLTCTETTACWEYADGLTLTWKMTGSGISISLSKPALLSIVLDIRAMYAYPTLGRTYRPDVKNNIVTYDDGVLSRHPFIHIRTKDSLNYTGRWMEQTYPRDVARNSSPDHLFTYELATVVTEHIALGFGWDAAGAVDASLTASRQRPRAPHMSISHTHDTLVNQSVIAKASVTQSLEWLTTDQGMYAGLPWFHQVWSRDELIASLGLPREKQLAILRRYMHMPLVDGELPTFQGSGTTCADGLGWLCLLAEELALESLSEDDHYQLAVLLGKANTGLKRSRQAQHGLIRSGHNATWMDTIGREGYRVEIQAMYALLLSQLHRLTGEEKHAQDRIRFIGQTRQHLFKQGYLHDGLGDPAKRPNVFLAYLIQPDLLTQQNWISCFDIVLAATTTPWGGLSSLDAADHRFQATTTGEDNRSYHQGDSWFFVNNLAAMALYRLDARRYGKRIINLLQSSTDEILWEHMIGRPGEISSASHLDSFGCGIQAFSGGTYLALLEELEGHSGRQDRDATMFFWDNTADSQSEILFS